MRPTYLLSLLAAGRVLSQNTNPDSEDTNSNTDSDSDDSTTTTTSTTDSNEQAISESLAQIASQITTTIDDATVPTGDYITYSSTVYLTADGSVVGSTAVPVTGTPGSNTSTATNATITSTSDSVTVLMGGQTTITGNATMNSTQSSTPTPSSTPVNTQPCNGYPEFCDRRYSNITMIAAHNSPFSVQGNVASNQALNVNYQLDDGVRMRMFKPKLIDLFDAN